MCFATPQPQFLFDSLYGEGARLVGRRSAPLWRILDELLRNNFMDNDIIVPSIDVRSDALSIADKKGGVVLPLFKFAFVGYGCGSVLLALLASRSLAAPRGAASVGSRLPFLLPRSST